MQEDKLEREAEEWKLKLKEQNKADICVINLLKNELLSEDGVLPLPWVRLSHLDTVQVDVTVGVCEILRRQLVSLLNIQH